MTECTRTLEVVDPGAQLAAEELPYTLEAIAEELMLETVDPDATLEAC